MVNTQNKHTIKNRIVKKALKVLSEYSKEPVDQNLAINGGIATQLYTAPFFQDALRPTHDLDIIVDERFSAPIFRESLGHYYVENAKNYRPEINVLHHVYEILLREENSLKFLVHSYKYTKKRFQAEKKDLERQVSNSNTIKIPRSEEEVKVIRPEDLVYGKLRRLETMENYGSLPAEFRREYCFVKNQDWEFLIDQKLKEWLNALKLQKEELSIMYDRGESEFRKAKNAYTASKDIYDVVTILKLADKKNLDFDSHYYNSILEGTA